VDPRTVAEVAEAFALGAPTAAPAFVARGAMGEIWRLETSTGPWAVKRLFHPTPDGTPGDVRLQAAAAGVGIRLPEVRTGPGGKVVVGGTRVYRWADLGPSMATPVDAATAEAAGGILGRLHALALPPDPGDEVDGWYLEAPDDVRWLDLADRADAAADRAPWRDALRRRLPRLRELSSFVAGADPSRAADLIVCHCDFTPANVFRAASGDDPRLVVVDWENAGPLSAEAELAMSLTAWVGIDGAPAFLAGYRAGGGTASVRGAASFAVDVATVVNFVACMVEQALETDDEGHRAFSEARLATLLGDGSGVEQVAARLAAVPAQGWTP
jgi:hypothetical protein